jgi:hypothetical protein
MEMHYIEIPRMCNHPTKALCTEKASRSTFEQIVPVEELDTDVCFTKLHRAVKSFVAGNNGDVVTTSGLSKGNVSAYHGGTAE